jgi:hypothetical protein
VKISVVRAVSMRVRGTRKRMRGVKDEEGPETKVPGGARTSRVRSAARPILTRNRVSWILSRYSTEFYSYHVLTNDFRMGELFNVLILKSILCFEKHK